MVGENRQIDATIEVVTPENIAFEYQVAGPFRRLPAFLIDLGIRAAFIFLLWIMLAFSTLVIGAFSIMVLLIVFFLIDWFYGGLFEALMNGQTPGKRVMGIRVLTTDGRPINGLQAILRNVLRIVDMWPMVSLATFGGPAHVYLLPTYLVGLVAMTMTTRYQRVGDLACGTMVVVEDPHWLSGVAEIEDARAFELASYLPADYQVSRTLARALAHYVDRRRFLSTLRRREVARHLGDPLLRKFGLPSDTSHDLLLCSLYYRTFISERSADEEHLAAARESPFLPIQEQMPLARKSPKISPRA